MSLTLAPTFDLTCLPIALVPKNQRTLDAIDIMNTGYKGALDFSMLGIESCMVLGEIRNPPKTWKEGTESETCGYFIVMDTTRKSESDPNVVEPNRMLIVEVSGF